MLEKQDTRRLNTAELILPTETDQAAVPPAVMPKSPLDWPVEMFTQALDRREVNRQALLKWIESNLQPRIDFGQIHVVGKNKCQYAKNGNPQECPNKYHWSKPSLVEAGCGEDMRNAWADTEVPQSGSIRKSRYRGSDPQNDHPEVRASYRKRLCGGRRHRRQNGR